MHPIQPSTRRSRANSAHAGSRRRCAAWPALGLALLSGVLARLEAAERLVEFSTQTAAFAFGSDGAFQSIRVGAASRECLARGQPSALLSLRFNGKYSSPEQASWDAGKGILTLRYPDRHAVAAVRVTPRKTHVVFEVIDLQPASDVELVRWGPYPLTVGETVGEIVGVVRDREVALGIQALNAKTLGGAPEHENDIEAEYGAEDRGYYPGLPAELKKGQGFRGDTARATAFGSVLQAYCRQRDRERVLPNWGHDKYRVAAYKDGGVVGSSIALFACPEGAALDTVGAVELAEGLPHPLIDGVWGKVSPGATAAYLIVDFGEANVDRAIEMTRRAGLRYLYHSSPFETWGHFALKTNLFPRGWEGLRACVKTAEAAGVHVGFHTLSNFITPNDPFVTPRPDPGLAPVGGAALAGPVDSAATELAVTEREYFASKSALNTVRVGSELVRFASVSEQAPWRLLGCERGAWGTQASPHEGGAQVDRLLDHDYKVFLGDAELSRTIARNIASLCNQTGALQLSFDGLEGNWASGYGQYGRTLFVKAWYDALDPSLQGRVINDASNPGHFNWHINTRMNWGEPWYAGFRESQTLYRFKNQILFERNLMPHMLGWFALRPETSLEDAEWLLARAAGFDAGFALATSLASTAQLEADPASADTARRFGATGSILEAMRQWETARMTGAFPSEVKARLRDNTREFVLRPAGAVGWELKEARVERFTCAAGTNQTILANFHNPEVPQPLQWILTSTASAPLPQVRLSVAGRLVVDLASAAVPPRGSLRFSGGAEAVITDSAWREVGRVPVLAAAADVPVGDVPVRVEAALPGGAALKVELRTLGRPVELRPARPQPRD